MMRLQKKAFTLIEMLIVIVIIGILAAALIPRLMSARGRANDTARKADLQQVGTALISYQVDNGQFPEDPASLDQIKNDLIKWGLASIPHDPSRSTEVIWVYVDDPTVGEYLYTPIIKNWFPNWGFVLMSKTETENGSNYVICDAGDEIDYDSEYDDLELCESFEVDEEDCFQADSNGVCVYDKAGWQLRYIYKY